MLVNVGSAAVDRSRLHSQSGRNEFYGNGKPELEKGSDGGKRTS